DFKNIPISPEFTICTKTGTELLPCHEALTSAHHTSSPLCLHRGRRLVPLVSDPYQWLDVDLGKRTSVSAVATQGRYGSSDWLTAYLLMFSDTGHNWRQHRQEDSAFPGNTNADSVVQYKLEQPVIARFLRLIPLDWNPTGRIGLRLEVYGCPYTSDVAHFDGGSALVYKLTGRPSSTATETVSLKFKSLRNSGTLLHAEGRGGRHSLTLVLEKGRLLLYQQQGGSSMSGGHLLASVGSLLDDQHWHYVKLERVEGHLNLTADHTTHPVHLPAELSHWDIDQVTSHRPGGGGTLDDEMPMSGPALSNRNLSGCLENLLYNNLNLIELAKKNNPQGNVTFSCSEPVSVAVTFGDSLSFLSLQPGAGAGTLAVEMQIRTWNRAGLLATSALSVGQGALWLYVSEARLKLLVRRQQRSVVELSAGSGLNDGQWHSVKLSLTQDTDSAPECSNPFGAFQGCMRLLSVDSQPVDLIKVQQRLLGNYSHLKIDMCGIIDRCSPSLCEHGALCTQSWNSFHCNCSNSGYTGATCHTSAYEQSCEAYKHRGNTSGHYYVDVDGSGPIRPQPVYCNMTEDRAWMVIQHNNTELTRVSPSPDEPQHAAFFHYASEEEQLMGVINQSEHCQQELAYYCRRSRLLNTPDGSPFSWWLGGPGTGQEQLFWGGAVPGSRQCSCGLQHNCLDPSHYCNCDADRDHWTNDSGLLTQKETLPVRSLLIGDVQRPESEAAYMVGPLRCHGDKNFWNAAFFDKETSYLHFPTFHGELNADISFFFKTTSASGVFLENLGIKDFIRIELRSPSEVVFSLDVGNGPLEVRVLTPAPLNDDRWHRVRAERNVKEASLRVDEHPPSTHRAPTDGHIHLQLNSQLFIGQTNAKSGTASRQKGFLGCVRALQLNGETLDLEQRARVTPGVRAGCPGHCATYGPLCRNQGRCVEGDRGFHCHCGTSAFAGAFCHQGTRWRTRRRRSSLSGGQEHRVSEEQESAGENMSLSFRTSHSPAMLLYVASYRQDIALLVNAQGKRRTPGASCGGRGRFITANATAERIFAFCFDTPVTEITLRRPRTKAFGHVLIPDLEDLEPELAAVASQGFSGCLSAVRFNSLTPLKTALLTPDPAVRLSGPLVHSNCAAASSANPYAAETTHSLSGTSSIPISSLYPVIPPGVIAVVIFVTVAALVVTARFVCSRKETYRTQQVKASQSEDGHEFPFSSSQADSQTANNENPNEYFI
uniref:Contactin associated protein like 3 n=1 Tax=Neogobius melanostomus TaxID=47308 RepID=A0A8C6UWR8_9GOBI